MMAHRHTRKELLMMSETALDLCITLLPPPPAAAPETIATIELRCDQLGLSYTGDVLSDPFTTREREDVRWYLEEYVEWPYEQFLARGKKIEAALSDFGKRLYREVCASPGAMSVVQAWRLQPGVQQRQVSIVSDIPRALSLPWELLHDEQGFLVLRTRTPVSLLRRLPQRELGAFPTSFEPPLRILLVTARPDDAAFIDPRSIARELLDEVQPQVDKGAIALEWLRPPTLPALRARLSDASQPPIQVLHFDGHGVFGGGKNGQGMLAFEGEDGRADLIRAEDVAQVLQDSGIRLAVLTACQSALGAADDAFSSVAAQFIRSGVDAVMAMSASVLVVTATRYVEALYRALAAGIPAPVAQERARQALHDDPRRNVHRRRLDDEGTVVTLRDWWLPHYYQQRPVSLQPTKPARKRKHVAETALPRLNDRIPAAPRYGFSGRSYELLQIERALLHKKLVVIHGFGGMGKTALAREAAEWFTRTNLYDGACFVSFEQGGDATTVLSALGSYLGVYDGHYNPNEIKAALARLQPVLQAKRILVIADNLESILPNGEAPLDAAERTQLWDVLLELAKMGAGMLLTSRDTAFGDGRLAPGNQTRHLSLQGLQPDDAYALTSRVLSDLGIDRARAPYADLRDLLAQLDHHPLAIQLVLPALRNHPLATIRADFAALLPTFVDDTASGHNRSLLASLDYSLRRLRPEQRALLPRLALFEGGALEDDLLAITQIPAVEWATLRPALEQAALLVAEQVHEAFALPFLHFHPVLIPFLRQEAGTAGGTAFASLSQRYARRYADLANYLKDESFQHPEPVFALMRRELPNLRKALELLLQAGEAEAASLLADKLADFLTSLGLMRERDQLRQRVEQALAAMPASADGGLTRAEYVQELGRAQEERLSGKLQAAFARLTHLLTRIQVLSAGAEVGPGSYADCRTLKELGSCLENAGQLQAALGRFGEALVLLEVLLKQKPEDPSMRIMHANLLKDLGNVLRNQGQYARAQAHYEQALQEQRAMKNSYDEAVTLEGLGNLALLQQDYPQARSRFLQALEQHSAMEAPARQAVNWYQLGLVAQRQRAWEEAERCYRESLALDERIGNTAGTATTCNVLATVAKDAGRPAEAEGWYKGALERIERVEPGGMAHARYLNNLASLLVNEVRAGRADRTRLVEARRYIEQARRIEEQPGVSAELWTIYALLAAVAELEEQPEVARDYRRQERERYAAFAGNRFQIDQQHADLIAAIVAAARGDTQAQATVEAALPKLEERGWHVSDAVQRIWKGERDWQVLAEGLDRGSALLVLRVLETLAAPPDAPHAAKEW
jgi:tetratricopeptide (TPR) repeat protein